MKAALLALALAGAAPGTPAAPPGGAGEKVVASADDLRALLAPLRGKVVVVHLWASWCEPCVEELPRLAATAKALEPRGVVVLSLAADPPENAAGVRAFAARHGATFETRILVAGPEALAPALGLSELGGSLPSTFVLDRDGRLRVRIPRPTRPGELEREVAPLLPPARAGRALPPDGTAPAR